MRDPKSPCVYILASKRNGTLYTGVTSNLPTRVWQHRNGEKSGFAHAYGCSVLVWYEVHERMESAILRENRSRVETEGESWR